MTQSILITGGLGYVGGRVAQALARYREFDVTVTTRNPGASELPPWLPADRCIRLDMLNDAEIADAVSNADAIVHCAALFGVTPGIVQPEPLLSERSAELTYSIEKLKSTGFSLAGSVDQEIDKILRFCDQYCRKVS